MKSAGVLRDLPRTKVCSCAARCARNWGQLKLPPAKMEEDCAGVLC